MPTSRQVIAQRKLKGLVPSSGQLDLDTNVFSDIRSLQYEITIFNEVEGKNERLTLFGSKQGTEVIDSVNNILGDRLKILVNLIKDGTDVKLRVFNNETYPLNIQALRSKV